MLIRPIKGDMASMLISLIKGGVASVSISHSKRGVASVFSAIKVGVTCVLKLTHFIDAALHHITAKQLRSDFFHIKFFNVSFVSV